MLDKVEPPTIPEGYAMSVAFHCLLDLVRGITTMIEGEIGQAETDSQISAEETPSQTSDQKDLRTVSDPPEQEPGYYVMICFYRTNALNTMYLSTFLRGCFIMGSGKMGHCELFLQNATESSLIDRHLDICQIFFFLFFFLIMGRFLC